MKILTFKIFFLSIYLLSSSTVYSIEELKIKNLIFHEEAKNLSNVIFKDIKNNDVNIEDFKGKLIILNFWASWCAPCLEEMPSLNDLQDNKLFKNLKIIAVNVGREKLSKSINFYNKLNINNLDIYFDPSLNLAKKFNLRGLPTTILIDREGKEFARIMGYINFKDNKFIGFLKKFD